jgi:ferredoxin
MSKSVRLRVDWAACDAHGLCEQWAPELITRDEWGFPILVAGPVPPQALEHARAAVLSCPVLALKLVPMR